MTNSNTCFKVIMQNKCSVLARDGIYRSGFYKFSDEKGMTFSGFGIILVEASRHTSVYTDCPDDRQNTDQIGVQYEIKSQTTGNIQTF